jgi:hypothetical protein
MIRILEERVWRERHEFRVVSIASRPRLSFPYYIVLFQGGLSGEDNLQSD